MTMLPKDQLTIRPARPDDLDRLVEFSAAMARETEGRTLDRDRLRRGTLAVLQSPEKGFYLVAEGSSKAERPMLGQLMVTYEWSDWRNATFWWIQSVYVIPSWRRRGVYRQIHESVVAEARSRPDVCGVRLYVEADNTTAQMVYRRVGMLPSSYCVFEKDFVLPKKQNCSDRTGM